MTVWPSSRSWVLSDRDIAYYRTFGFVVIPCLLEPSEAVDIGDEIIEAHRDAFGPHWHQWERGGSIDGHHLPMMVPHTPYSSELVDDPRLLDIAEDLLGRLVVPLHAEGACYFGDTDWHCDDGSGVSGLKVTMYLEPLSADRGGLRLLPLSAGAEAGSKLTAYAAYQAESAGDVEFTANLAAFPFYEIETQPGDAVVSDLSTWYASTGGRHRHAWSGAYLALPDGAEERRRLLRFVARYQDQTGRSFDHDRYPVWRDWTAEPVPPDRREAVDRLTECGILDLPGALLGDAVADRRAGPASPAG